MPLSRRRLIQLLGASAAASHAPAVFARGVEDRAFIFLILRGGLDGLGTLIPDDRETEGLRGAILPPPGDRLDLGNGFRLHPALSTLHALYRSGEAAFVHAAATAYRDRSHFDGQDFLETLGRSAARDGWLNRTVAALGGEGLAVGYALPLALKGAAPATNWSPPVFPAASEDLLDRLADLYADDAVFAEPLAASRANAETDLDMGTGRGNIAAQYTGALSVLGKLMAAPGGPGIGMASLDGWDTHANQAGALSNRLGALDAAIAALKTALGPRWKKSCILVASEFGRTAAANGTRGTDHGTGGLAMLLGGAVQGGQVAGDWPGLAPRALHEGRDLAPANDLEGLLKSVLGEHLGIDRAVLDQDVLPVTGPAMPGLIRS